jgi:hypothetical protein
MGKPHELNCLMSFLSLVAAVNYILSVNSDIFEKIHFVTWPIIKNTLTTQKTEM